MTIILIFSFTLRRQPDILRLAAKYNFKSKSIVLHFWDDNFDWSLVSICGLYVFGRKNIKETEFVEITQKESMHHLMPRKTKSKFFKLDIKNIYRHILMKQFTVDIQYMYLEDVDMKLFQSRHSFDVITFLLIPLITFLMLLDRSRFHISQLTLKSSSSISATFLRANRSTHCSTSSSSRTLISRRKICCC